MKLCLNSHAGFVKSVKVILVLVSGFLCLGLCPLCSLSLCYTFQWVSDSAKNFWRCWRGECCSVLQVHVLRWLKVSTLEPDTAWFKSQPHHLLDLTLGKVLNVSLPKLSQLCSKDNQSSKFIELCAKHTRKYNCSHKDQARGRHSLNVRGYLRTNYQDQNPLPRKDEGEEGE